MKWGNDGDDLVKRLTRRRGFVVIELDSRSIVIDLATIVALEFDDDAGLTVHLSSGASLSLPDADEEIYDSVSARLGRDA